MRLHHFNFPYDRDMRITEGQMEAVAAYCLQHGYRHVGIYGMAEAGTRLAERLGREAGLSIAGCFDQRHAELTAGAPPALAILPPSAVAATAPLDCLINTAPPTYLIDVAETLAALTPGTPLLSLYDPLLYLDEKPDYPYKLYQQLSRTIHGPEEIAALARGMRQRLQKHIARWYGAKSPAPAAQIATSDAIVSTRRRSLGNHLDAELRRCLSQEDTAKVPSLLALAEAFPFFAIARDAAACLLVQSGDRAAAAAAFLPALRDYPCCHHTHVKAAELCLLAGDFTQAAALARTALALAPGYRGSIDYNGPFTAQDQRIILEKWMRRRLLPPLERRDSIPLRIASPVWGHAYLDMFLNVTLPSLLAAGNIPHAARHNDVCYTLYTRRCDRSRVEAHAAWKELAACIPAEIVAIEDVDAAAGGEASKYSAMSRYHSDALRKSREDGRYTFLTLSDFLFSNSFLKHVVETVRQGYDTMLFHSTRFMHEDVLERIAPYRQGSTRIDIAARELMAVCLPCIHQSQTNYITRQDLPYVPNTYYRYDGEKNLIEHVFGRTPLLVAPQPEEVHCIVGFDVDLAYSITDGGLGKYFIVPDTSEMAFVELTPRDAETQTHTEGEADDKAFSHWLHTNTDPVSRYFGAHSFVFRHSRTPEAFSDDQIRLAQRVNPLLV